jgi:glucose/arabinose dehydrogenase
MKQSKTLATYLILLAMIGGALGFSGCASSREHKTENLLSAAGFHTLTPTTPRQQATYSSLPPYKVQRREADGKVLYAYVDKKNGILYVGNENNYQRFKQLGQEQKIADEQLEAAQMNQDASMNWGYWGPAGMWW